MEAYFKQSTQHAKKLVLFKVLTTLAIAASAVFVFSGQSVQALSYDPADYYGSDFYFDLYGWSIDAFDAEIEVFDDATFVVTETIDVTYGIYKHGIFREIPTVYRDEFGNRLTIDVDVLAVYQDGAPAMVDVYGNGYERIIKIGDPNTTITGAHEYQIVYEVERALLYQDDTTTFYWNVTGNDWEVPIASTSAVVTFPDGAEPVEWSCYTGAYGATYQDCGTAQEEEIIAFASDGYMTVAIDVPAGIIWEPTTVDRLAWFAQDNWLAVVPLLALVFMVGWWLSRGRDPKRHETIIAQYDPPEGLWAVYVGMLLSQRPQKRFITAMVIQLAAKGYIEMTVAGNTKKKHPGNITLKKLKDGDDLDEGHKLLFDLFFKKKDEVKLNKIKGKILPSEMSAVRKALHDKMIEDGYYYKGSFVRQIIGIVLGSAVLLACPVGFALFGTFTGLMFIVCGVIMIVLGYLMPKVTEKGAEARWYAQGFELFLKTADQYRSAFQERENIFSDFLPYAIALNHVDEWAKAFKNMAQAPDWYHSVHPFMYTAFISEMNQVTNVVTLATTPVAPSSGGGYSGGGGFSGGGFGGGGGGSW